MFSEPEGEADESVVDKGRGREREGRSKLEKE